jgi:hypothetical protein
MTILAGTGLRSCFRILLRMMHRAEVGLVHPTTGHVRLVDRAGENSDVSVGELLRRVRTLPEISWQWWFDSMTDVFCSLRKASCGGVASCGLDGLESAEVERLLAAFLELPTWFASKDLAVAVFDSDAVAQDVDWEQLLSTRWAPMDLGDACHFPVALVLRDDLVERLRGIPPGVEVSRVGSFRVFRPVVS